jgi:enoyl-CoA hydratase/carnithine racemase
MADLLCEVSDRVATITFNRPDKRNALTFPMVDELTAMLDAVNADDSVRALIITGAGSAFCAGTDLSGEARWSARPGNAATGEGVPLDTNAKVVMRLYEMNKVTIAAVNGAAVGAGSSILTACDVRFASETARVGYVYAARGICTESASSWFLPRAVGISRAVEWVATGRMIDGEELVSSGLMRELLRADQLLPKARALAAEIARNTSPAAVAVSRRLMWNNLSAPHPLDASLLESRGLTGLMGLTDASEGARAFMEKRAPDYKTRPSRDVGFLDSWWPKRKT